MNPKNDIQQLADVKLLVDSFYEKVKMDALLAPIFNDRITGDWQPHMDKMYQFWSAALLNIPGYKGTPFLPHARMAIGEAHFTRWLQLFAATLEEHFAGPVANEAMERALIMANLFLERIEDIQSQSTSYIQ